MRVVIQKKIVKIIQPEMVQYFCDDCGSCCGYRGNEKNTYYREGETFHQCKQCYDRRWKR